MPKAYNGYVIHEDGRVWRPARKTTRRDGVSRMMPEGWVATRVRKSDRGSGGGYVYIDLHVTDSSGHLVLEHWLLHRLIASVFIGKPQGDVEVNHKDGNRANNAVDNLEWVTHSDNQKHAYRIGIRKPTSKVTQAQKSEIVSLRNAGNRSLKDIAAMFGISFQSVSRIALGA
jgi:hypothetical protein